ncbi:MAG: hypothetical protein U0359_23545 [Byssovorax sp.]
MISEDEAREIAHTFLTKRRTAGCSFRLYPAPQRQPDDWVIVFEVVGETGGILDGPMVVLVSKQDGRARTLEEDIEERFSRR